LVAASSAEEAETKAAAIVGRKEESKKMYADGDTGKS